MRYQAVLEVKKKNGYHHRHINTDKTIHLIGMDFASAERQVGERRKKILSGVSVPSSPLFMELESLLWSFPAAAILTSALTLFFTQEPSENREKEAFIEAAIKAELKPNFSIQSCGENITFIVK